MNSQSVLATAVLALVLPGFVFAVDCDGNGAEDAADIASGASDCDDNGALDACEVLDYVRFRPFVEMPVPESSIHRVTSMTMADLDDDGTPDLVSAGHTPTLSVFERGGFLFLGDSEPPCRDAADTYDDGALDIGDAVSILGYLFLGYEEPAAPGVPAFPCSRDRQRPGMTGNLGCKAYAPCES